MSDMIGNLRNMCGMLGDEAADRIEELESEIETLQAQVERLTAELADYRKALEVRNKQLGVACMKHDLVHSLACGICLTETRDLAEHWAILAEQRRVELEEWRELLKRLWIACPTALECNAFHHAKRDQHTYSEECKPLNEYVEAIEAVNAAMGVKP